MWRRQFPGGVGGGGGGFCGVGDGVIPKDQVLHNVPEDESLFPGDLHRRLVQTGSCSLFLTMFHLFYIPFLCAGT